MTAAARRTARKQRQKAAKAKAKAEKSTKQLEERFATAELEKKKALEDAERGVVMPISIPDPKAKARPAPKRLSHEFKKDVTCEECQFTGSWRKLKAVWTLIHQQVTKDDDPDLWSVVYSCIPCTAKKEGKTEDIVMEEVFSKPMSSKRFRAGSFMQNCIKVRTEFAMMDASNRKVRMMSRDTLATLCAPLGVYALRKGEALTKVCKDVKAHEVLVERLKHCRTLQEEEVIMAEMDLLEVDDGYLAYQDKGEDQHRWILASSYSDAWTMIMDRSGAVIGCILSWYVCFGHSRDSGPPRWIKCPCCRVLPSKDWDTLHDDPLAPGQRWYCDPKSCNTRYKAGWGQLVQVSKRDRKTGKMIDMYMRAECPPWDMEDVRAMWTVDNIAAKTSEELYAKVKRIVPATSALIIPDPTLPGQMMLESVAAWEKVPEFSWWEIFGILGVPPPKGVKAPKGWSELIEV